MVLLARAGKLFNRLVRGKPISGRELQLRCETLLLYSLATGTKPADASLPEALSKCVDDVLFSSSSIPSFEEQANVVQSYLLQSVVKTISTILNAHDPTHNHTNEHIRNFLGFVPRVMQSTIHGAGLGLHVQGHARSGALIALYPGRCYLPSDLPNLPDYPKITKANEYLIWRYDGIVIDGKEAVDPDQEVVEPKGCETVDSGEKLITKFSLHPFAHGHRVNHPTFGCTPNCLQFMLNIPLSSEMMPLRPFIPNYMFSVGKRPILDRMLNQGIRQRVPSTAVFGAVTGSNNYLPVVVLIATRDIENEEVFINYRFNPSSPDIPSWYNDCDVESSNRRWSETAWFTR